MTFQFSKIINFHMMFSKIINFLCMYLWSIIFEVCNQRRKNGCSLYCILGSFLLISVRSRCREKHKLVRLREQCMQSRLEVHCMQSTLGEQCTRRKIAKCTPLYTPPWMAKCTPKRMSAVWWQASQQRLTRCRPILSEIIK